MGDNPFAARFSPLHIQPVLRRGCGSQFIRLLITGISSVVIERLETNALAPAFFAADRWLEQSKPETMTTDVWGERSRTIRVPSTPSVPGRRKSMRTMSTRSVSTIFSASPTVPASRSRNWPNEAWITFGGLYP
jgi:hypothetical protein